MIRSGDTKSKGSLSLLFCILQRWAVLSIQGIILILALFKIKSSTIISFYLNYDPNWFYSITANMAENDEMDFVELRPVPNQYKNHIQYLIIALDVFL
jgi:hypothetical protein